MTSPDQNPTIPDSRSSFVWYVGAFILAVSYPNTFVIWQGISLYLGPTIAPVVPIVATAVVFIAAILWLYRHKFSPGVGPSTPNRPKWIWFASGVIIAVAGIFAADPNFPAKRIHIPQYILLAVVVRRALLFDLPPRWIFPGVVVVTIMLGIHDELIQGLLESRTFGVRDIGVNSLGALSGAAMGVGLSLFSVREKTNAPTPKAPTPKAWTLVGISLVILGLVLMLAPLEHFRDISTPIWTMPPILAAGLAAVLISWRDPFSHTRPFAYFILITLTLPAYLMLSHANTINFH